MGLPGLPRRDDETDEINETNGIAQSINVRDQPNIPIGEVIDIQEHRYIKLFSFVSFIPSVS